MADYYPLLARAVAGLQTSTPGARQAIYERARGALLAQLRGIQPPLAELDIERESDALEAAVRRLEDEFAALAAPSKRPRRAATPRSPDELASQRRDDEVAELEERRADTAPSRSSRTGRQRIEPTHPAAPSPVMRQESKARFWIVGFTIVAVVGIIGATAYFMRDRADEIRSAVSNTKAADPAVSGTAKIAARADPDLHAAPTATLPVIQRKPIAIPVPVPATVPKPQQPDPTPAPSAVPPKDPVAVATPSAPPVKPPPAVVPSQPAAGPPSGASPPKPAAPVPTTTPTPPEELPATYRAALLVAAPELPERRKIFVGTVVWRSAAATVDPGRPPLTAVIADLDIPEAKVKVSMVLQKNNDTALSASGTMRFRFSVAANGAIQGVKSISMPQMRADGAQRGDDLDGVGIVPITTSDYLVALKQGAESIAHNTELLNTRNWIDLQFVVDDGKAAKVTFEKGPQGNKIVSTTLAGWK